MTDHLQQEKPTVTPVNQETIPDELKHYDSWVCWRLKWDEKKQKWSKPPYRPDGRVADKTNPSHWSSFVNVMEAYRNEQNRFDGIGFCTSENDPFAFVDLDHCVKDGLPVNGSFAIVEQVQTYTEKSPSGTGLHLIAKGKFPADRKKKVIELYSNSAYLTITGDVMFDTGIEERQDELDRLYQAHFGDPAIGAEKIQTKEPVSLPDQQLLGRIQASNDAKFKTLFSGDTSGYSSHSEADAALCIKLAFWTGKDAAQIDRIFRMSGLYRAKWDERHGQQTYGELTIRRAIEKCVETVDGRPQDSACSQGSQYEEWLPPVNIENPELPSIDTDDLPTVFADMAQGIVKATEVPLELPVLLGLATVATACQKRFVVEPEPGYREPLNIWTLTFLEPGNRKSAVQQILAKPLIEYERELAKEMEPVIQEATAKKKNQEARIAFLRGQLTKGKAGDLVAMEKELIDLESNPIIVPGRVQTWTQDITPERLGAIMAENNESIAILSAEGGIFENIGGRYSGSVPNLDVFLQAHAGDAVRVDRGSREPVFMQSPALTMGLSVQPGILSELARHRSFRSLGLWARFLFAIPRSPLGYRTLNTTPIPPPVSHSFNQMVRNLLSIPCRCDDDGKSQPFILKLEGEAHAMWKIFSLVVEEQLADGGDFEHIRDWAGKLPGQAARIAGLLHCMEHASKSPWTVPISDQTMDKALNLVATLSVHAQSVFDLMGATVEMMAAMKIWNWVKRNRLEQFTKRDCYQALKGSFQKVAELEPGLSLLVERYYLRDVPLAQTGAGRKKELYKVNPALMEQWR